MGLRVFLKVGFPILGVSLFLLTACSDRNSVEFDNRKYPAIDTTGMTAAQVRFARARQVLIANCAECHSSFSTLTEAEYQSKSADKGKDLLASPGNLLGSAIYRVLRYSGDSDYMPPLPQQPLEDYELEVLRDWILGIGKI